MKKTNILNNIILGFSFSYILFFFAPLDFLYTNKHELWLDLYNIISAVMILSVVSFIVIAVTLNILEKLPLIASLVRHIVAFLIICLYIQGNYVPIPYGNLDGTPIMWNEYMPENIMSVALWLGIAVLVIVAVYRWGFENQ